MNIPIIKELKTASKDDWIEAAKELLFTLFFSLMPVWLGFIMITLLALPETPFSFISKFAASSDLSLISASLIGPLLYMMFGKSITEGKLSMPFPSGLWFLILIFFLCLIATVIYCFTYISETDWFYDLAGKKIIFTNEDAVMYISFAVFAVSIFLILSALTIQNSIQNPTSLMRNDTANYVDDLQRQGAPNTAALATDTDDFVANMRQENNNAGPE